MAHIQRRGDKRWRARYIDPDGKERSMTFARRIEAEQFLTTVESDKLRGQYVDVHNRTTVAEYARHWAAARPHRAGTASRVDSMIRTHVEGTRLGGRRLVAVRPSEVQAWVADRAQVLSPTTLRNLVGLLRSVYAAAVLDRLVGTSPVVRLQLPKATRERVVPLSVEQVRSLAAAMPERNRAMVTRRQG